MTKNPATGQEKSRIFLLAELVKRFVEVLSYVKMKVKEFWFIGCKGA